MLYLIQKCDSAAASHKVACVMQKFLRPRMLKTGFISSDQRLNRCIRCFSTILAENTQRGGSGIYILCKRGFYEYKKAR
mgnify:CR=1 FL=1